MGDGTANGVVFAVVGTGASRPVDRGGGDAAATASDREIVGADSSVALVFTPLAHPTASTAGTASALTRFF
jgi:hypothetical protein